jgi:hypothetical protein
MLRTVLFVILELDMMPVAIQSLVSSHPICETCEQRAGNTGERVQSEAVADSTDDHL